MTSMNTPDNSANPPDRSDIDELQAILGQRYQLQWIIGRGGMSTVWLAKDTQSGHGDQDVAIKILRPEYTENEEFRTRFRNESEASKELDSPNVVATYDYGEVEIGDPGYRTMTVCFIVMEYVKGESLADVLSREHTLPEKLVADLLAQAATGLEEIHTSGMVHRDIKPGNILITADGVAKITDFGISKAAEAVPLTRTGMVVGTAQYVSPEQAQGLQVGPASDVYSLGVVGYECLAGRRPFSGESTVSVAIKHIAEDPAPLPPEVSPYMREFIGVCLRKSPAARYANGSEMSSAIALVAQGQRPPQPHHVPDVDTAHPLTEQLGAVATGPGTAVPPLQGPAQQNPAQQAPAHTPPGQAAGVPGLAGSASDTTTNTARDKSRRSNAPAILLILLAVVAAGIAIFMFLNSRDQPAPQQETTTITNEVTTPNTQRDTPQQAPTVQSTVIVTEDPSTDEPTSPEVEEPTSQPSQSRPQQPTSQPGTSQGNGGNGGTGQPSGQDNPSNGGTSGNNGNNGNGTGGTDDPMIEGAASTVDSTANSPGMLTGPTGKSATGGTNNPPA